MSAVTAVPLAPDAALAARDRLLDVDHVARHAARLLGADGRLDVRDVEIVRAKYRVGDSLRVVYRLHLPDGARTVSVRSFADDERVAAALALTPVRCEGLWSRVPDPEHGAAWWAFPDDRRVTGLARLLRPEGELAALPTGRWVASQVMEYAPERSATVRALGDDGRVLGYAKAYRHAADAVAVADLYRDLGAVLAGHAATVRTPGVLAVDAAAGITVLEAMPGARWDELDVAAAGRLLPLLGAAVAHLHGAPVPADLSRFGRLDPARVVTGCRVVAAARPDVAAAAERLAARLAEAAPADPGPAVVLHGDLHPKNALLDGDRLALIDLDQASWGPAAADLGSLVARLHYGELVGEHDAGTATARTGAALTAYAGVRPLPPVASLRWHVAAALVAERAVRAVNRVHPRALAVLPDILTAAERCLDREDLP